MTIDYFQHGPCPHCGRCRDCGQTAPLRVPYVGTSPGLLTNPARPLTSPAPYRPSYTGDAPLNTFDAPVPLNPCL